MSCFTFDPHSDRFTINTLEFENNKPNLILSITDQADLRIKEIYGSIALDLN